MPLLDLRDHQGCLVADARSRVASLMVEPRAAREADRDELLSSKGALVQALAKSRPSGVVAGGTLIRLFELHAADRLDVKNHGARKSRRAGVTEALEHVAQAIRFDDDERLGLEKYPRSSDVKSPNAKTSDRARDFYSRSSYDKPFTGVHKSKLIKLWKYYRPVAHLWAATYFLEQHMQASHRDREYVSELLGVADALLKEAEQLPWTTNPNTRRREPILPPKEMWRFAIPVGEIPQMHIGWPGGCN